MDPLVLVGFVIVTFASVCNACSCGYANDNPEQYCSFDVIFRGVALAEYMERKHAMDYKDPLARYSPYNHWVYSVSVKQPMLMAEGMNESSALEIRTSTQDSLCGARFFLDVEMLFFARVNTEGKLETGMCDGNRPWNSMSKWEQELFTHHVRDVCKNKGEAPPPPTNEGEELPPLPPQDKDVSESMSESTQLPFEP